MSDPTVSTYWNQTTPAPDSGMQPAVIKSDNATPQDSRTISVPNTGGVSVKTADYTLAVGDCGRLVVLNSASAHTYTLPATPPSVGTNQWQVRVSNEGAGVLTLAVTSPTLLDGVATSIALATNAGLTILTDGTNYFTERGNAVPGITQGSTLSALFVQGANGWANADSVGVAYTSANTAGDCLVASVAWNDWFIGWSSSSVSDTKGNTWSKIASTHSGSHYTEIWVALNCAAGANTITAAASPSASQHVITLAIHEYSNIATASAVDAFNSAVSNGVATLSTTVTPALAGDLLLVATSYANPAVSGTVSSSPGTSRETVNATGGTTALNLYTFDATLSSAGSNTVTATYGTSSGPLESAIVAVTLKVATIVTGTVTSVGLTVPSRQSVSGSPVVGAGTFGITDNDESANTVFAGPASGSAAAPTFRALVSADLPSVLSNPMTAAGDIIIGGSSGTPTRLAKATDGEVLTLVSGAPAWAAGGGGGGGSLILVEAHTASSSASLDFTTGITSTYDEYVIEILGMIPATNGAAPLLRFSTNGGTSYDTSTIYDWSHVNIALGVSGSGSNAQGSVDGICIFADSSRVGLSSTATPGMAATFRIYDPRSASNYKLVTGQGLARYSGNSSTYLFQFGGLYRSVTAVNAFRIIMTSGNIASGTVRVYGVAH